MEKRRWSSAEDAILREYVEKHGEGNWHLIEKNSNLRRRSGKSCRLRWRDHLRPGLKKGPLTTEEQELLLHLHKNMGNKWSQIAKHFPGRTDNELKNFWHMRIRRCRVNSSRHGTSSDGGALEFDGGRRFIEFQDPSLYENPAAAAIIENHEIHDNSAAGSENEHTLSQLEETQLEEDRYNRQFESESGDTAKEAAAVEVEPLPIATMEESLEQSWSDHFWNEAFSGCNLAMDWELHSIQNNEFDGLWDDIFFQDV